MSDQELGRVLLVLEGDTMDERLSDEPCYVISIAAKIVEMHPQTLRHYEHLGLLVPARSRGNVRLYSPHDIERLRKISRLTNELGVNLAGVEVILRLTETVEKLQAELNRVQQEHALEIELLRRRIADHGIPWD